MNFAAPLMRVTVVGLTVPRASSWDVWAVFPGLGSQGGEGGPPGLLTACAPRPVAPLQS